MRSSVPPAGSAGPGVCRSARCGRRHCVVVCLAAGALAVLTCVAVPAAIAGGRSSASSRPLVPAVAVEGSFTGDEDSPHFGSCVALSGDTALVPTSSAAYIFVRSGTSWSRQAKLVVPYDPDGDVVLEMAEHGAVSGDTAVVEVDSVRGNDLSGSAYVYARSGAAWSLQAQLSAPAGDDPSEFAKSLAIDGDTAVVGGSLVDGGAGAAYVFTRTGTSWTLAARLSGDDGSPTFGDSVAIEGTTVLVGDYWQNKAYVFTRSGSGWDRQALITSSQIAEGDKFGDAVFLSGDTALIGASGDDVGDYGPDVGSAYVFVRSGAEWVQQGFLRGFGGAAGLSGDIALTRRGSISVFARSGTTWNPAPRIFEPGGAVYGAALADKTLLVGTRSIPDDTGESQYAVQAARLVRDVIPPAVEASPSTVKRGRLTRIPYRVDDATQPPSYLEGRGNNDWEYVTVSILKGAASRVRFERLVPCNVDFAAGFRCTLPKGRYTVKITATDLAGNTQTKVGITDLTVM